MPGLFNLMNLVNHRAIRRALHQRIERCENLQTFAGQVFFAVIAGQLVAHQVQKCRERCDTAGSHFGNAKIGHLGALELFVIDLVDRQQSIQHQIAALAGALLMATWIIK